ncbi:OapA family protein [Marinobacterium lutimaris]|uniref:Murein DD-endopeptidase MepM and murein hydrolase activator NlpD, contain LysM domain n=1 Tax=Marinobacterium lutimaris TaxID=568106 RepID=A0A1H6D4J7_9GAMM|nr:peptidoglycan DD-metalloendopeptidase family protein [Marinobacterium lutimaris]SEG80267.1 Murein DD-endopeptidase MepM and murein hydrolase activator NlpD, contain LysM domain [Marinobacterium lutimaris]
MIRKASSFVISLPRVHLAAASICTAIIGTTLLLLPSEEVEATRSTLKIIQPGDQPLATLPLSSTDTASSDTLSLDPESETVNPLSDEVAETPQALAEAPAPIIENWIDFEVRSGDSLSTLFQRAGLSARDVYQVSQATKESGELSRLYPGQTISFLIEGGKLEKMRFAEDRLNTVELVRNDSGYSIDRTTLEPRIEQQTASGVISNSLFVDAERAGLSSRMIMQMAQVLGWDVDFALDIRKGDHFRVLYEEKYLDDEKIGEGDILAVEFVNDGRLVQAVRFTDSHGDSNYYTPQGMSMRKAFLRSPVDFRRISSNFNPERFHPVLGKKRPHRGTDYAASTGTAIKAAGDGKIIWRGTKGGYGRTIIVQHGGNITTLYAHMNGYKSGLSNGSRVKQGDIIGYVGMSGTATGPHLHYEFRVNGVHKNPVTVDLPHASPVPKAELAAFNKQSAQLMAMLDAGQPALAMADNTQTNELSN